MITISIKMDDERLQRLRRWADEANQSPDDAADTLVEEGLRMREFPGVHFRDTGIGRQAFVPGLRLPMYFLAELAREVDDDLAAIAEYYGISTDTVAISLDYIRAFPDEIARDIAGHDAAEEQLLATLPTDHVIIVP